MNESSESSGNNKNEADPSTSADIDELKFMDFENFSKFYDQFSNTIKETVSASTKIPLKQNELDYYLTCPSFKSFLQTQNSRILKLIASILKQQNIKKTNIYSSKLDDEERMDLLIDTNDQIIEKLGIQLDEIQGLRKKTETELKLSVTDLKLTSRNINTSWNKNMGMVVNKTLLETLQSKNFQGAPGSQSVGLVDTKKTGVAHKPQRFFLDKINNSPLPFVPKLRYKPNALVPLPEIFAKLDDSEFVFDKAFFNTHFYLLENPYSHEISQLFPNESDFELKSTIETPANLEQTHFKYIDTVEDLDWLCSHLGRANRSSVKEIAVDLEHHSYRSFLGFTCLMQISTRTQDFIVDTIKLRPEMHRLNEVFTDWTLVKVFHGADFDIEWLQKDFGIYVVNMFDTGQASRVLQYPHFSLSYLLQKFCNINAQKQYQLADWRQRPLNQAMLRYAREDTHYLLFIYDNLRNELIINQAKSSTNEINELSVVYEKSKTICKKTYKKPLYYSRGFLALCQHNSNLNAKQMKALHDLYEWRDRIARESDESCEYVLKNHQMLKIAELLPREIYGILALCNPLSSLVEANVHEMLEIVKKAREFKGTVASLDLKDTEKNPYAETAAGEAVVNHSQTSSVLDSIVHLTTFDPDSILNCPHDVPHNDQKQTDADELMDTTHTSVRDEMHMVAKLSLKELLIKPNRNIANQQALPMLPLSLEEKPSSMLNYLSINSKKSQQINLKQAEKLKLSLEEKVRKINETLENPFYMFLPSDLRQVEGSRTSEVNNWNLIRPKEKAKTELIVQQKKEINQENRPSDIIMIPLKQQFKLEKYSGLEKKNKKKFLKNVDFTDALIEYNNSKAKKMSETLGSTELDMQQNQLSTLIQEKIKNNLKILSESVNKEGNSSTQIEKEQKEEQEDSIDDSNAKAKFSYDPNVINKLFKRPYQEENNNSGPKHKKINNNEKVNKRRATNAVTRSKNHHSMTFKPNASASKK